MEIIDKDLSLAISYISSALSGHIDKRLKDPLIREHYEDWVRLHGLGRKVDPIITMTKLVALNLILKMAIYETIRDHYCLEKLSETNIHRLSNLINRLRNASGIDALKETILDELVENEYSAIEYLLPQINKCIDKLKCSQNDIIGKLYEEIVAQEERRRLGQFWTPYDISEFMVNWSIRNKNCALFDPALGSGIFMLSALSTFKKYGINAEDAINNLYGIDISPICVLMSTTNVILRAKCAKPNFLIGDFLKLTSLNTPFNVAFDSIVCNPPYSRHHELDPEYKRNVVNKIREMTGIKLSKLCSNFVYYFINAAQFLKPHGRMAFIIPYEAFEAFYSAPLKKFIIEKLALKALILFDEHGFAFPGVETAASIILVEGAEGDRSDVKFIKVTKWPGVQHLLEVVENKNLRGTFEWGHVNIIPYSRVEVNEKWTIYANSEAPTIRSPLIVPLRELALVMRGIATGANEFFTLTDDEILKWKIEPEFLKPVISRTRDIQNYILTREDLERLGKMGKKRWLFYCNLTPEALENTKAFEYIKYGERAGYPERSLIKLRKRWYELERREAPKIIFTYLTRGNARFIYNAADALALNVFLLIYPINEILNDPIKLKALLAYLNSEVAKMQLRRVGRTYGGKTLKLEPRELDNLPVLDVRKLSRNQLERLAALFDGLCRSKSSTYKVEMDKVIKELL